MNKIFTKTIFGQLLVLLFPLIYISCDEALNAPTTISLRSRSYSFNESFPPAGVLAGDDSEGSLEFASGAIKSLTVKMSVSLEVPVEEVSLLDIPGVLNVSTRNQDPAVWGPQNYPSFPMPDGTVPVLEAALTLYSDIGAGEVRDLVVGIPVAILDEPAGKHDVVLDFTGVRWSLFVDGTLYDNDFAIGYPVPEKDLSWNINPTVVDKASLWVPGLEAVQENRAVDHDRLAASSATGIQYWTPPYHNAWVGDVAAIQYHGLYHLFYLFDRRGHGSKFGKGGHYFEHLSTVDFKDWTEQVAVAPLEEQCETFGTGTPFILHDSLFLSYGLHTTRIYPREKTSLPEQWDYLNRNGKTGFFSFSDPEGKVPDGTSWSVCMDGVATFERSRKIAHPCENPSIFTDEQGNLRMLANYGAKGTWASDDLAGGWRCIDPDFPKGGDCTFPFSWGGYDYIVGGFSSLWGRLSGMDDLQWKDMVAYGEDFYNGISVPSVTVLDDGRCIMAGWLKMRNWGGALVLYELVQLPDGALGSKWMEEVVPATEGRKLLSKNIGDLAEFTVSNPSFMLSFEVEPENPGEGKCSVRFLPGKGGEPCVWSLDMVECRAQYSDMGDSKEKTLAEGGRVAGAGNYAVKNGMCFDGPFSVRMAVKTDPKFNGSIIDTEIAGTKTMASFREGLEVGAIQFEVKGCKIKKVFVSKML